MTWYLDTNICVDFLRGKNKNLIRRLLQHQPGDIKLPAMVKGELIVGALKSKKIQRNMRQIREFLNLFEIVPFDDKATFSYGLIRASLETSGQIIGPNDLIIAATVFSREGILVTHNTREFSRIEELSFEDWTE